MKIIHCLDTDDRTVRCGVARGRDILVATEENYLALTDGELEDVVKCPECEKTRTQTPVQEPA